MVDKLEPDALAVKNRQRESDDEDARRDAQRKMAWFALSGMLAYPLFIVFCSYLGLDQATVSLASTAGVYYLSVSAIVATFFTVDKLGGKK